MPFLRNFKHSTAVLKATKQLFRYVGWLGVSCYYQIMTKNKFGKIQIKILSENELKNDESEDFELVLFDVLNTDDVDIAELENDELSLKV